MTFDELFVRATQAPRPFPYQTRLAGLDALPTLLEAPTGAGKTAAIVLGWLWHRQFRGPEVAQRTSRRLVYCLPMRVLVDQVSGEVTRWVERLGVDVGVHVLRGGSLDESWERYPDRDRVIVGTQDQLLSRALHRGYAMSRFRWSVPFGLLNNDAHWVLDEVQLMGPGLRTAAQLHGLRAKLGAYGPVGTTFMSATLERTWLATPDFDPQAIDEGAHVQLRAEDWSEKTLSQRATAKKPVERAPASDPKPLAEWIASTVHVPGTLTLVVVNRVARAQEIAKHLRASLPSASHALIHSRFRRADRRSNEALLTAELPAEGRIVVATQTIEAGVDLDAHQLVTDLAPWPSLVQRFGRCNRRGDRDEGRVFWVDLDLDKKANAAPYEVDALTDARARLEALPDARIDRLPKATVPWPTTDLPRRSDVVGLFDTDPDLDGNFIDVSRWVRGEGIADAHVYWRDVDEQPGADDRAPHPDELCAVAVDAFRGFVKKAGRPRRIWQWDAFEGRWRRAHLDAGGNAPGFISPGQTYLAATDVGGYDEKLGWTGKPGGSVPVAESDAMELDAFGRDHRSESKGFVALDVHLRDCATRAGSICEAVSHLGDEVAAQVVEAAGWHDVGKAHAVFQDAAGRGERPLLAKAPRFRPYGRRGFRHELVSALLAVRAGRPDLVAFLVAAHHGKVRVSLRPLQWTELAPEGELRGVRADDAVPSVATPSGSSPEAPPLPMGLAVLGRGPDGASWTDRVSRLLQSQGPFRLAYLEALVRIADWAASETPSVWLEDGHG
ncbi:MAG: CRISPR-associated helicase Cas3' [Sandaracinaceae bacterium]